ncbi:SPS19 (YNL202W) [Zygosaccharomyces parabailii]|nr:SPS19 (YNL202W) [Zygosaccharomyces parabailii]CDH13435.1 probable Peroxisomal 2,4-dienoyl-CoA reductase SPS19 [Zygosaccharomyces bailii ISA1307]
MVNTLDAAFVTKGPWKSNLFQGKVVFVTGGGGTICRVQTEALVVLGAKAAIIGRSESNTITVAEEISKLAEPGAVLPIPKIDVRDYKQLEQAVAQTVKKFGHIDYVIAGAAGNFIADVAHLSPNAFKSVVDIDLLGSFNTVKACLPELLKSKGSVLFVSATLHYYGVPFQAHVGAAKAGVDALSNALAVELGPLGIRCNCIAPGPIENTEGMRRLAPGDFKARAAEAVPLQRLGTTKDIADVTVFLFSPAASFVNGTVTAVDGGAWHVGATFTRDMYPKRLVESIKSKF